MHCMTIYQDDILVFSPTIGQHLLDLCAVFEKLHSDKLFAKCKKCFFGKLLMKYWEHTAEVGSLCADPDKFEAICMLSKPITVKEL